MGFPSCEDDFFAVGRNIWIYGIGESGHELIISVGVGDGYVKMGVPVAIAFFESRISKNGSSSFDLSDGDSFVKPRLFRMKSIV